MGRLLLLCLALLGGAFAHADVRWPGHDDPGSKFIPVQTVIEGMDVIVGVLPAMAIEDGTLVRPVFLSIEQANVGSCRTYGVLPLQYDMSVSCGWGTDWAVEVAPKSGLTWRDVGRKDDVTVRVDREPVAAPDK